MRNNTFFVLMGLMMVAFVTLVFLFTDKPSVNRRMDRDRVKYLRDSLEMEYYKKQLESYPYDHSEIKDTTVIKYGGENNPYEVIKVCEAWGLDKDAYIFNVVKYVARAGKKDQAKELEDLKKAAFYLDRKIKNLEL
jgi:hypothetical protein